MERFYDQLQFKKKLFVMVPPTHEKEFKRQKNSVQSLLITIAGFIARALHSDLATHSDSLLVDSNNNLYNVMFCNYLLPTT